MATEMENNEQNGLLHLTLQDVPGLGPKTAKMLRDEGIDTPARLMESSFDELEQAGLTRPAAKKLKQAIADMFPNIFPDFHLGVDLEDIEGIGPTTARALREKGMNVGLLETTPVKELEERYGLTANAAIKYQTFIVENLRGGMFTNGLEILEKMQKSETFTFGAESIDQLTFIDELGNGGVRRGETYELFGSFRSGKSQLCHQLAVTVQLPPELGGLGKKAVYIDTEGTFSPSRIVQIANRFKEQKGWDKPVEDVLRDVMYARAKNSDGQQAAVIKLLEFLGKCPDEFGLVIVDSVTAHFRAEYAGRGTLAERQQILNAHLNSLHRIADTYNVAVVVTNQVQANPAQFFGDPTTAVGGNIMGHWAGTRFYLRKSKGEKRVIKVFDSPVLPESEAVFEITGQGILSSE
ncbi:MAG: DNA repair and recombination protein RadA [Methanobacteriota archaeon]|nr:MAG: DNA repair and recombination protein RadA [Euryarchaeota archaeon]